jgi:hypothetical protein
MIGQWVLSYQKKQIPELESEPVRIKFHIVGEIVTALALIVGAAGLLVDPGWGRQVYLVALGMLFYTTIVSPGYFAQQGKWGWVGMFAVVISLGLVSLFLVI